MVNIPDDMSEDFHWDDWQFILAETKLESFLYYADIFVEADLEKFFVS